MASYRSMYVCVLGIVHVCVQVYKPMFLCAVQEDDTGVLFYHPPLHSLETGSLSPHPRAFHLCSQGNHSCAVLGLRAHMAMPGLHVGAGDLNSCSHNYIASTVTYQVTSLVPSSRLLSLLCS